jgi:hypothetical protein
MFSSPVRCRNCAGFSQCQSVISQWYSRAHSSVSCRVVAYLWCVRDPHRNQCTHILYLNIFKCWIIPPVFLVIRGIFIHFLGNAIIRLIEKEEIPSGAGPWTHLTEWKSVRDKTNFISLNAFDMLHKDSYNTMLDSPSSLSIPDIFIC